MVETSERTIYKWFVIIFSKREEDAETVYWLAYLES
jgi:hypothetical protein